MHRNISFMAYIESSPFQRQSLQGKSLILDQVSHILHITLKVNIMVNGEPGSDYPVDPPFKFTLPWRIFRRVYLQPLVLIPYSYFSYHIIFHIK